VLRASDLDDQNTWYTTFEDFLARPETTSQSLSGFEAYQSPLPNTTTFNELSLKGTVLDSSLEPI
jgi:hypothetical protein